MHHSWYGSARPTARFQGLSPTQIGAATEQSRTSRSRRFQATPLARAALSCAKKRCGSRFACGEVASPYRSGAYSGHTDSSGSAAKNKELSGQRAAVVVKELVAKGIPAAETESMGMGSERPLEKPDDTPAKKARNRRYEIQVRL